MNNYEHEVPCPENKGIRNYLWYDYFHDSDINNIFFDHTMGLVELTLECSRERGEMWNKLTGDYDAREAYMDKNIESFTYILTFKGTKYFHTERLIAMNDYLNGRFKDTALLRKLAAENKKALYHFRIQIDDGYMDIIFSDFIIRKKLGRVKYPIKKITYQTGQWLDEDAKKTAITGDDYQRFLAMKELFHKNDPALPEIVRKNLWFDDYGDACLYSAYLLGKLGDLNDVPKLLELYLRIEEYFMAKSVSRCGVVMPKRNILDAIELIYQRNALPVFEDVDKC
ncbi:MAG: hypothetical protein FWC60_12355 [Firmicutes bacterium]|nr:hypothetical protein [Bacillota bacterium]